MPVRARHQENIDKIILVAERLQHLRERVVFIGGSIVGLLITDQGAPDVRKTKDVDIVVEVTGFSGHVEAEAELRQLGFRNDISGDGHILRFLLDELIVDILPTDGTRYGMDTSWYAEAARTALSIEIKDQLTIKVINGPLLICTKLAAYYDRGGNSLQESKDIGDILALVDGRAELLSEVEDSSNEVKDYIASGFKMLLDSSNISDVLAWQLDQDQQQREALIMARISSISQVS